MAGIEFQHFLFGLVGRVSVGCLAFSSLLLGSSLPLRNMAANLGHHCLQTGCPACRWHHAGEGRLIGELGSGAQVKNHTVLAQRSAPVILRMRLSLLVEMQQR